jgi:hypothetical protein
VDSRVVVVVVSVEVDGEVFGAGSCEIARAANTRMLKNVELLAAVVGDEIMKKPTKFCIQELVSIAHLVRKAAKCRPRLMLMAQGIGGRAITHRSHHVNGEAPDDNVQRQRAELLRKL